MKSPGLLVFATISKFYKHYVGQRKYTNPLLFTGQSHANLHLDSLSGRDAGWSLESVSLFPGHLAGPHFSTCFGISYEEMTQF